MTATIVGLLVAVATAIAYGALADRFEYASVRRRQLDVLAALVAFLCFGGIVYGGVATRLSSAEHPSPPVAATPSAPALDGTGLAVGTTVAVAPEPSTAPVQLLAPPPPGAEALVVLPDPASPGDGEPDTADDAAAGGAIPLATLGPVEPGVPLATLAVPTAVAPTAAVVVPTATRMAAAPTPTPVSPVVTRVAPPVAPPTRTIAPPTPIAPTQVPMPLPSPTANCGNPAQAQVTMSDLSAAADRTGADLVIRFRARVRNDAPFPVTVADTSVMAVNKVAGAEQYGHTRLPDVTIEPGAVITLEGVVTLTKLPPPFGTTELCVSFVLDTCGARAERPVRQCAAVRGF